MLDLELPSRYEAAARLGKGGGGEVWAVRDKFTGKTYALKVLAPRASARQMAALVREAAALSGLEGLGLPRVVRFGRMPESGRPYLVRELASGASLESLIRKNTSVTTALSALAQAADQLTLLHRAGVFHGDVKPANIVVAPGGRATLVDLGLSAPWRGAGAPAEGLTPRYAAPELLQRGPLTVRAEVFALGATLDEILERAPTLETERLRELELVVKRATASNADDRFPSAEEFAVAVRRAARLSTSTDASPGDLLWPIGGIDATSARLLEAAERLEPSGALAILGKPGSGRSALLRRLAWSLGASGRDVAWIDDDAVETPECIEAELKSLEGGAQPFLLIDDADLVGDTGRVLLERVWRAGARLISVGQCAFAPPGITFEVPPLERAVAVELVRRAIPSLTDKLLGRVLEASECSPGELRRIVRALAAQPVASAADLERAIHVGREPKQALPSTPLERAVYHLDRGRYDEAQAILEGAATPAGRAQQLEWAIARVRLELGVGDAARALTVLREAELLLGPDTAPASAQLWRLYAVRAHLGIGDYPRAVELAGELLHAPAALGAEAGAYSGLALSYLGKHTEAEQALRAAVSTAQRAGDDRVLGITLAVLGVCLQRVDKNEEAQVTYARAIEAAERSSDAGTLATVQLNLAGLLKVNGDIAGAIVHFEAALDMGKRSGRRVTVRQALLNLANLDLYLGRLAKARQSIEALLEDAGQLPPEMRAQLYGAEAELCARTGDVARSEALYERCAGAYSVLGRGLDAAEARLERVLAAGRSSHAELSHLRAELEAAQAELGDGTSHRPLLLLASARVALLAADDVGAARQLDDALAAARASGQREWLWRALEARAELHERGGQTLLARRDREDALAVLEEIAARLPRDLREVYWNDPRRRKLRASVQREGQSRAGSVSAGLSVAHVREIRSQSRLDGGASSELTPLEWRLSRILEVNSVLAGEHDLERLTARIIDHAVDLLRAERGYLLLCREDRTLSVFTSRSRLADDRHVDFSRSIAATVIETGQPVVSVSARDDTRMNGFPSVHQLMLQSVACMPIRSPAGQPIGALYLETRARQGRHFEAELDTLSALADQVAIALENARLINENKQRADQLAESNRLLEQAQARLQELLQDRTEQLERTRRKLRETRETLFGHFGYLGLVGTSAAMRRVYALIERVKDTDVPVLITGESGTGKEVVARAIHGASPRSKAQFLGVNCGAIPEHLLEAELFGHVRGAYTGASRDRKGLFREAARGTILLDEIGEMPHKMQAGLLRVLQDRTVRPVGGSEEEPVDVRLLFATHRDLAALVKAGRFREDLFYRIHVVEVRVPPLRERSEDIPQLVDHFLGIFTARYRRDRKTLSRDALRRLMSFSWPGNVRQLEHVLLNAYVLSEGAEIDVEDIDLPLENGERRAAESVHASEPGPSRGSRDRISRPLPSGTAPRRKSRISQHRSEERERILKALQACNWNRVKAAEMSGIPRRTFYRRLREYGIQ